MYLFISLAFLAIIVHWSLNRVDNKVDKQKEIDKSNLPNKTNETKMKTQQEVVHLISDYFNKNDMRYWLSEDRKTFRVGFDMDNEGKFEVFIKVEDNYLVFNCGVLENIKDDAVANTLDIIARINQFYNLGFLTFYFESRNVFFKNVYFHFENELTENKFKMYFDSTIDGARSCRPLVSRVALLGEEPVIAMMSIGNNS